MFWLGQYPWAIQEFMHLHLENGIIYPCLPLEIFSFLGCMWLSLALPGEFWNKVGSAWPPGLCHGMKKHDTYPSPSVLYFLSRKCGNPAADNSTIAPTPDNLCSQLDWGSLLLMLLKIHVSWVKYFQFAKLAFSRLVEKLLEVQTVNNHYVSPVCPLVSFPASTFTLPCLYNGHSIVTQHRAWFGLCKQNIQNHSTDRWKGIKSSCLEMLTLLC